MGMFSSEPQSKPEPNQTKPKIRVKVANQNWTNSSVQCLEKFWTLWTHLNLNHWNKIYLEFSHSVIWKLCGWLVNDIALAFWMVLPMWHALGACGNWHMPHHPHSVPCRHGTPDLCHSATIYQFFTYCKITVLIDLTHLTHSFQHSILKWAQENLQEYGCDQVH